MGVSCDLEVDVNGEEVFIVDKVSSLLVASSFLHFVFVKKLLFFFPVSKI